MPNRDTGVGAAMGAAVGLRVGARVGRRDGSLVGILVGALVGARVGFRVGDRVGAGEVGRLVGALVGLAVGGTLVQAKQSGPGGEAAKLRFVLTGHLVPSKVLRTLVPTLDNDNFKPQGQRFCFKTEKRKVSERSVTLRTSQFDTG